MTKNNNHMKQCLMEKLLISLGFVLIHDGRKNPGQFRLPPREIAYYTKKYRLKLDGEFVNTWATFRYDQRTGFYDYEITCHQPSVGYGHETAVISQEGVDK